MDRGVGLRSKISKLRAEKPKLFYTLACIFLVVASLLLFGIKKITASDAPLVTNIALDPALDLSRFASYNALASIDRLPQSETATVSLRGVSAEGGGHWDK